MASRQGNPAEKAPAGLESDLPGFAPAQPTIASVEASSGLAPHVRSSFVLIPMVALAACAPARNPDPPLILNGALDHVIPQESLDQLAAGLPNGHVFVFEGVAHSPVDVGDCALTTMMAFLADPSTAPDSACMADCRHTFALSD